MDSIEALHRAHQEFATRVEMVGGAQWEHQSACDEWTVGDLVDHVIGGNVFTTKVLRGATADAAMEAAVQVAESSVGNRKAAYLATATEMLELFDSEYVADRVYHHASGDVTGQVVVALRTNDIALHAWDLAHSIGVAEDLDPKLVEMVWKNMSPYADDLAASGRFGTGASGDLGEEAPLQDRLLDISGRRQRGAHQT